MARGEGSAGLACCVMLTCAALCMTIQGMAADRSIGTRIRRARERLRMRQEDLAAALGVSRNTVDAWENERSYPKSSIGALEDVLGVTLDDGARVVPPEVRARLSKLLSEEDYRRVLGVLEGTLTWPSPPAAPGERPAGRAEDQRGG